MSSKTGEAKKVGTIDPLKNPEVGEVLSEGLAVLYAKKPKNPVEYLALWLLNTAHEQTVKLGVSSIIGLQLEEHKRKAAALQEQHKEQMLKRQQQVSTLGRYQRYNLLG